MSEVDDADDPGRISRQEARALIDAAESGTLVVIEGEPVPALGDVPQDDREVDYSLRSYRFGTPPGELE